MIIKKYGQENVYFDPNQSKFGITFPATSKYAAPEIHWFRDLKTLEKAYLEKTSQRVVVKAMISNTRYAQSTSIFEANIVKVKKYKYRHVFVDDKGFRHED